VEGLPTVGMEALEVLLPDVLILEPREMVGPLGLRWHRISSRILVRQRRSVCAWEWNSQPIYEIKGAWMEWL